MPFSSKTITEKESRNVQKLIKASEKITVLGHHSPDPDCFSSILSIACILKNIYKKKVEIVFQGKILQRIENYANALGFKIESTKVTQKKFKNTDLLFIADVQDTLRTNPESIELDLSGFKNVVIIDHHPIDKRIEKYPLYRISRDTSSTAELVFRLFKSDIAKLPKKMSKKVAEFLAYGIISDSKRFITPPVSRETFEVIIEMIDYGVNISGLTYSVTSLPLECFQMMGKLFDKIKIHKLGFGYMYLEDGDLPRDRDEADSLLDSFKHETQKVKDFDLFVMFQGKRKNKKGHESKKKYTYKIRTRSIETDMTAFNKKLGGGGHPQSGGSFIYADNDEDALSILAKKYKQIVLKKS
ncbi:DHH family phosphoesterase [Candidatus Dojkabacteria bacterium]|nr:DHH family phosphoesterase [Candidatus Dojkabacteria bacterium]